jgi:hypothetical protein
MDMLLGDSHNLNLNIEIIPTTKAIRIMHHKHSEITHQEQ